MISDHKAWHMAKERAYGKANQPKNFTSLRDEKIATKNRMIHE